MTCQDAARLLKALAEPTRLRIVCLLSRYDEICVCDLTEIMEMPQYHISRHLAVLRNLGIVIDERDGVRMNYRLATDHALVADLARLLAPEIRSCPRAADDLRRASDLLSKTTTA